MCMALPGSLAMRLGHERRVHLVAQRRLARGALEEERLIGKVQRMPMDKLISICAGPILVDQRVDFDILVLAELIDVVEQRIELVDGGDL